MTETVFLVSQPRAGSTLLQRILGAHPSIHIEAEPWILLPLLYPLRYPDTTAGYDHTVARDAILDFIRTLPDGESTYLHAVRAMADTLYKSSAEGAGKRIFVDKTPRYHYILPELTSAFPESLLILMYRHPLAVLASIIETFTGSDAELAAGFYDDLVHAPTRLVDAQILERHRTAIIRYEDLVSEPEETVRAICNHVGIEFAESMLNYGHRPPPSGRAGDPVGVHRRSRPDTTSLDRWHSKIEDPHVWNWFNEYVKLLSPEVVAKMGYDYSAMADLVESHRPARVSLAKTPFSYGGRVQTPALTPIRRLRRSVSTRGWRETLRALLGR